MCFFFSYQNKDFFEECKQEYLKKREDFQKDYVQSGETKDMKKKDSVILWQVVNNLGMQVYWYRYKIIFVPKKMQNGQ